MTKCKVMRSSDEYQCGCGLTWGIDEQDPHVMTATEIQQSFESDEYKNSMNESRSSFNEAVAELVKPLTDAMEEVCRESKNTPVHDYYVKQMRGLLKDKPMNLESEFTFGKHKGHQLEDVIEDDPQYIEWCVVNDVADFDEESLELISKKGIA